MIDSLKKKLAKKLMAMSEPKGNWVIHYKDGRESKISVYKKDALLFLKRFNGEYIENKKTGKRIYG